MYRRSDRLRFSEMDHEGKMKLVSLMDALQDCSDAQSEALGIGYSWLRERNRGWILLSWHVIIERYPEDREDYVVETRPWKFERFYGHRNFAIYDKQENALVKADSKWGFMDTQKMRPVRPAPEESGPYGVDPRLDMEYLTEKHIPLPEVTEQVEPIRVTKDLLDLNEHVNNVRYIWMADRLMPHDFRARELKAEYRTAAKEGDVIIPSVGEYDGWKTVILADENGGIYAVVALRG